MEVKILTKQKFADLAGVSAAAVTKAAATSLKDAIISGRIDANHPDAVKYLEEHARSKTDVATDPLLLSADRACKQAGIYTTGFLRKTFSIGAVRAARILAALQNNIINEAATAATIEEIVEEPKRRGRLSAKEVKIREYGELPPIEYEGEIIDLADLTLRELIAKFGTDVRFTDWLDALKKIEDIDEKRIKNAKMKEELISRELVKLCFIDPVNTLFTLLLTDGAKTTATELHPMVLGGTSVQEAEVFIRSKLSSFINKTKHKMAKALKNVDGD